MPVGHSPCTIEALNCIKGEPESSGLESDETQDTLFLLVCTHRNRKHALILSIENEAVRWEM